MNGADQIVTGDAFDVLPTLDSESVHACVTDPPYGLAFMGRDWDDFEPKEYQEWCEEWACEVKRVLKPGGHLLAFSGNRTHHRLFTGVEDAGFEVRDTITWHFAGGFPKASDISKTIDKRADAEREVVGTKADQPGYVDDGKSPPSNTYRGGVDGSLNNSPEKAEVTAPATDDARKWEGWKTALKPATEYVVVARKPFDGATVDCVLEHGTGALNIDECRIGDDVDTSRENSGEVGDGVKYSEARNPDMTTGCETGARYPSNVVFDAGAAEDLDEQVGELSGGTRTPQSSTASHSVDTPTRNDPDERQQLDGGGPSRYFKTVSWDGARPQDSPKRYKYTSKASKSERTLDGRIENAHPTVKPGDLMEWLVRLVTLEGQTVLDPFAGSGTTCRAAKKLGREFVGIEQQDRWADVARVRCGLTPDDPSHVRSDDEQTGIEAYTDGGEP